jgi:hypothetical protein
LPLSGPRPTRLTGIWRNNLDSEDMKELDPEWTKELFADIAMID